MKEDVIAANLANLRQSVNVHIPEHTRSHSGSL